MLFHIAGGSSFARVDAYAVSRMDCNMLGTSQGGLLAHQCIDVSSLKLAFIIYGIRQLHRTHRHTEAGLRHKQQIVSATEPLLMVTPSLGMPNLLLIKGQPVLAVLGQQSACSNTAATGIAGLCRPSYLLYFCHVTTQST